MVLDGLARLARLAGDGAAQEHLARRITRLGAGPRPETGPELVAALSAEASAAGAMPGAGGADDAAAAARFVLAARSAIIDDGGTDLALLPHFPGSWRGGPVEVHGAPTLAGTLSFAIRWHGYRPALLWELARPDPGRAAPAGPTSMSCPGLDPAWTSSEDRGETLLGGISQPLPAPPAAGESFS
jgi:hypothetical protein